MEVYFDNSATTRPYSEVIEVMADTMKNYYGNPSSAHLKGLDAEKKMTEAREVIAGTLNCKKDEIIFTSGGSESNNFLIKGFAKPNSHIITTKIEHPSVLNTCRELEDMGVKVTYLDVNEKGMVNIADVLDNINKDTVLVSIMHVNNEVGTIQDIEHIGKAIKEKNGRVKFHVDAVQSYGKFNIDVQKCKIDLLSASGHKIHGPRGIGIAFMRRGLEAKPLIAGGGQERGFRSGTENLAAIRGLSVAAQKVFENMEDNFEKAAKVKNYFIEKVKDIDGVKIHSIGSEFSPYILNISFMGVKGEVLLHALEGDGIYVSTGSACSAKKNKGSHVLSAIGLDEKEIRGAIRFSFTESNTIDEVDYTVGKLVNCLRFLRRLKI